MNHRIVGIVGAVIVAGQVMAGQMTLVKEGVPTCVIVVPKEKAMVAWFSAGELQRHIKMITGTTVPVVTDDMEIPTGEIKILIGDTVPTKALGLDGASMNQQEMLVQFKDKDTVVLLGNDRHMDPTFGKPQDSYTPDALNTVIGSQNGWCGTAYATEEFLEKRCGVRWLHPGALGICYTARTTLTVDTTDIRRVPAIEYRTPPFGGGMGMWPETDKRESALFEIRNKLGGQGRSNGHGLYGYLDRFKRQNPEHPEVWVESRPDYFAKYMDPTHDTVQMCYSSTALMDRVAQDAILYFTKGIRQFKDVAGPDYYHIMPQDVPSDCECPTCTSLRQPDGPFSALNTKAVWTFTDAVARKVAETCPGKFISQCAYLDYAAYPDGLSLASNILVGPALAIRTEWVNPDSREIKNYRTWVEKCPGRLGTLWVYPCFPNEGAEGRGYKCFPGFFARHVARFYRMFAQDGVRGIMNCGGGELIDAYAMIKYMDDVQPDEEAFLSDTVHAYYGAAAEPLLRFYQEAEDAYWNINDYPNKTFSSEEAVAWTYIGTQERMDRWQRFIDDAKSRATTSEERARVALLDNGIWAHMKTGFDTYHYKAQYKTEVEALRQEPPATFTVARIKTAATNGNPDNVIFPTDASVKIGRTTYGWPSKARSADVWMAHDGQYLYVKIDDHCDGSKVTPSADLWFWGKRWEIFFGAQRGKPYRQLGFMPINRVLYWTSEKGDTFEHGVQCKASTDASTWHIQFSIPLSSLSVNHDVKPGGRFYLQLIGPAWEGEDVLALTPITEPSKYHDMPRAAEITLAP